MMVIGGLAHDCVKILLSAGYTEIRTRPKHVAFAVARATEPIKVVKKIQ